jgi:hypothetical protein
MRCAAAQGSSATAGACHRVRCSASGNLCRARLGLQLHVLPLSVGPTVVGVACAFASLYSCTDLGGDCRSYRSRRPRLVHVQNTRAVVESSRGLLPWRCRAGSSHAMHAMHASLRRKLSLRQSTIFVGICTYLWCPACVGTGDWGRLRRPSRNTRPDGRVGSGRGVGLNASSTHIRHHPERKLYTGMLVHLHHPLPGAAGTLISVSPHSIPNAPLYIGGPIA